MEPKPVQIRIYYLGGCPNRHTTVERVKKVLKELGVAWELREVQVNPNWASLLHFLGTPTVHINGIDIERSARTSNAFSASCRTYREGDQIDGAPSERMIREAVLEATSSGRSPQSATAGNFS